MRQRSAEDRRQESLQLTVSGRAAFLQLRKTAEQYQTDLSAEFSVEEFAAALYLSPRALQLKMKALYNLTPSDYIRNIRLEFAQELLKNSELAIGLVAQQVGFNSQSYFARCFKAKYNMSPKQFREQS